MGARTAIECSPVITDIVDQGFCSGCGVCTAICPHGCLQMAWSEHGLRIPREVRPCQAQCGLCVDVCPFSSDGPNEDDLAEELFAAVPGSTKTEGLGYWVGAYVGHAVAGTCRQDGSSGGVARWFFAALLEMGHVERVLCVMPGPDADNLFCFAEALHPSDVLTSSKSAYYPTDVGAVLRAAMKSEGRFGLVALPCLAKATRLAARRIPALARSVGAVGGLVCGQLKSRGFTEYLSRALGVPPGELRRVSFRDKDPARPANDFTFVAVGAEKSGALTFASGPYGVAHGTGEFRPTACDACDDVFAETADIAFMDAWLPGYATDPKGTSIVLTRSAQADEVIRAGIDSGALDMQPISIADVLRSQAPRLKNKHSDLGRRLWMMKARGQLPPPKRVKPVRPGWHERLLLAACETVRRSSHEALNRQREVADAGLDVYHGMMRGPLRRQRYLRAISPARLRLRLSRLVSRLKRLFGGTRGGRQ